MMQLSYKYKIIIALAVFVLFAAGMFFYGYGILESRNQILARAATERETEYQLLEVERKSFEQGQKDLTSLAKKNIPPSELFSKNTKVVKEIKILESIAAQNNVTFSLSISGTAKSALKAVGTTSEIYTIPYGATLEGSFDGIMKFMQQIEHLPFVTHVKQMNITALENGNVRSQLNSEFYIKK